ncbi:MAG: PD-(D/E)XK nuclease family protein [Acidobacteria bacterium]|nr:PD-(D/E)XK nuclease family protein [Acidobacteriota bacterium]
MTLVIYHNQGAMLLVGPPGSGKTYRVLEELEAALAWGWRATLVVPTSSMAEHLQHQLARRGLATAAQAIVPLSRFMEGWTPECREVSAAMAVLLLERALERASIREFEAVAQYPGFHAQLLETIEEFWSAGRKGAPAGPFAQVMAQFEGLLREAGVVHRAQRLRLAASAIRKQKLGPVFFDGFFNFTPVELELLRAVAEAAERILITLPEAGAEDARQALVRLGMSETRLNRRHRQPVEPVVVHGPSPEREIEDVAGRILADREKTGRPFREYGLILRSPELYGPIVETVFERFGIPVRSQRRRALAGHGSIRFLAGLMRLAGGGFDGAEALEVLKLAGSGIGLRPQMDRYEFHLRSELPGQGLEFLLRYAEKFPDVERVLTRLRELAGWPGQSATPHEWAERCVELAGAWFRAPQIEDGVSQEQTLEWRTLGAALRGWAAAAEETSEALELGGTTSAGLGEYLEALEAVLRLTPLHAGDRRRNVVQALTVYEARQWELPVVFVCGLVEKQFPRHHPQNLFFPDAERRRLAGQGWRLLTSADRDREERFLFEIAVTRATEQLYLSFPAQDEAGGEAQESFFLAPWRDRANPSRRVRVREQKPAWRPAPAWLENPASLSDRHRHFGPSALDQYLQCPFLFFAQRTLKLAGPPAKPEDRVDALLKGKVIHLTLARWASEGAGEIRPVFEQVFAEMCEQEGIRLNFPAEALRMQLLDDLERFVEQERQRGLPAGFRPGPPEKEFRFVVEGGAEGPFEVTGRIDRHEISDVGAAVVVDYKYSTKERIQKLIEEHEQGERLQGLLYLLGLERELGLAPAGLVFYGVRQEPSRRGWYVAGMVPPDPDLSEYTAAEFRAMLEGAAERTLAVVREIRAGRVEVAPRDRQVCRTFCPFREVCRVEL